MDDDRLEQIFLCLVGRLNTDENYNPTIMKTVMKNAWKPLKGVVIRDPNKNFYAFQFFAQTD